MAESVKRRVAAARLAVAFVAAGTIAGATAWASAGPPPPKAQSSAFDAFLKIKSSNVVDGSLLYRDFAKGQVPSFDVFKKLDQSFLRNKKATTAFKTEISGNLNTLKGELGDVSGQVGRIKNELGSFVRQGDAILGDGSVFTATKAIPAGSNGVTMLDIQGLVKIDMTDTELTITNTGGGTLTHASCNAPAGGTQKSGTLGPGQTLTCLADGDTAAIQMVNGDGKVATLNFSNMELPNGTQGTVQVLVGL